MVKVTCLGDCASVVAVPSTPFCLEVPGRLEPRPGSRADVASDLPATKPMGTERGGHWQTRGADKGSGSAAPH